MNIMTKRGSLDNIVTFEHVCDTMSDLNNIPKEQITLGTTAIVLNDDNSAMAVFMANSKREWSSLLSMAGGNSNLDAPTINFHICSAAEIENGIPNIANPTTTTFYLVPGENIENNSYNEYFWNEANNSFELFSASQIGGLNSSEATKNTAGLMSAGDKTKLDDMIVMGNEDFLTMYNRIFGE